ncbi:MAG: exo-alpha-sialidase [Planctomycetales bacterium]|nr:exo-alpha-sialidase [Planctomycetales bacterium]
MKSLSVSLCIVALAVLLVSAASSVAADPDIVSSEFIYEKAPFPQCHASTIAETKEGLVAAWFGGTAEKNKDVGIWISRHSKEGWSEVKEVANGKESDTVRYPCWNPVLFQMPDGPLLLFYKVGPSPSSWWGMKIESADGGKTWSQPTRLPDNIAGPIKNKPELLADGRLLCGSSTEDKGWRVHMEWTKDVGKTWERTEPICDGKSVAAIQPTFLRQGKSLIILCRPRSVLSILRAESADYGRTWSPLVPTDLPNPGSGIDAVTLKNGQHLLIYNHTATGRSPLNLAASSDGKTWQAAVLLESEAGEYSYPAIMQSSDGLVHITYTWKRQRVKHVVVDPAKISLRPFEKGKWPE